VLAGRGSVPPQSGLNLNSEYVSCPHCGRRFAPGPAERHIPKCQNIKSRPPPPKQPHSGCTINFVVNSIRCVISHRAAVNRQAAQIHVHYQH
uniref:C2HC/C3H-type domain-containing protein n=2 Tax=Cyprinus carpio TaxID=7962 RepID=A0A9J8AAS5_CYPCA